MFGFVAALMATIAGFAALIARADKPVDESVRIEEARRQLREAGLHYEENSPEEVRAVRILLEGGPLSEC